MQVWISLSILVLSACSGGTAAALTDDERAILAQALSELPDLPSAHREFVTEFPDAGSWTESFTVSRMCVEMTLRGYPPDPAIGMLGDRSARPGPSRELAEDLLPDHLRPASPFSPCLSGYVQITNIVIEDDEASVWVDGRDGMGPAYGFGLGLTFERQPDGRWSKVGEWGWQA